MIAAIFFTFGATCPKASGLDQDFCSRIDKKTIVTGSPPIIPHTVSYVGTDFLLLLSREESYNLSIGRHRKRRRHILATVGRLPCVEGAPIAKPCGFGSCCRKRVIAIHDERARCLRISEYEKRQHKNVSVPEHMPLVSSSAQAAGAY